MNTILRLSLFLTHLIVSTTSFSVGSSLLKKNPTRRRPHEIVLHSTTTTDQQTKIVAPNQSFRDTQNGELSIATFNMLAPFYNSLAYEDLQERETFAKQDRQTRVPLAINMAKESNADILCLQEVEGLEHEAILKQLLAEPYSDNIEGYDSLLWSPLLPNREGDIVGVCVAWRSKKHKLVASNCFKRGMIVQMAEVDTGATFCIANVHLPARPSNILGRLKTMSATIQKIACYDPPRRQSPLDGLMMVVGDFNCDSNSVTARLLTTGKSPYGNLKDRNYKANVSKASASQMRHGYRFQNVYDQHADDKDNKNKNDNNNNSLREQYAPVTVSLHGRGPGCTDQMFYAQFEDAPKRRNQNPESITTIATNNDRKAMGRRKSRREKAARMRSKDIRTNSRSFLHTTQVRVDAVLATIAGPEDTDRLEMINKGLPNVEEGFPSDHIPIGALFVAGPNYKRTSVLDDPSLMMNDSSSMDLPVPSSSPLLREQIGGDGVSSRVRRRREAGAVSMSVRRRHNAVLRYVTDWLEARGATNVIRDQPLYKNKFVQGLVELKKKSRAPDLMCCLGRDDDNSLVIVEVTVSAKPDQVRTQKLEKYRDLAALLATSPVVQKAGLTVIKDPLFVIVLDEYGGIPEETRKDLDDLAALTASSDVEAKADAQRFCNHLQAMFTEVVQEAVAVV